MLKRAARLFELILFAFLILWTNLSCAKSPEPGDVPALSNQRGQVLSATPDTQGLELAVKASTVRVIETYPNDLTTNTDDVLANFPTRIVPVENGLLRIEINQPVIIEVPPFTHLQRKPNKRFGAQLAGQINELLPRSKYPTFKTLADRQEKITQLLSLAGVGILRDMHSYDTRRYQIEKTNGSYYFANVDLMTELASKYGMDMVARLSLHNGSPPHLPEGMPTNIDSYLNYIRKTVERYDGDKSFGCELAFPDCYVKGDGQHPAYGSDPQAWAGKHHIKYWETLKEPEPGRRNRVGNEPGLTAKDAAYLLNISYDAIKSVDKNAQVYFSGLGPVLYRGTAKERRDSEYNYLKEILESRQSIGFDILGFDAYIHDLVEKGVEYQSLIRGKSQSKQSLWIGQAGAPDIIAPGPYGGSQRRQSEDMVKIYTRAFANGIEKVFWGDFFDSSKERKEMPGRPAGIDRLMQATGLFYTETWELKPAYFTFKLLACELYDIRNIESIANNIFKITFNGRSDIYIAWPARDGERFSGNVRSFDR